MDSLPSFTDIVAKMLERGPSTVQVAVRSGRSARDGSAVLPSAVPVAPAVVQGRFMSAVSVNARPRLIPLRPPAALRGLAIELDVLGLKSVLVDSTDAQVRSRGASPLSEEGIEDRARSERPAPTEADDLRRPRGAATGCTATRALLASATTRAAVSASSSRASATSCTFSATSSRNVAPCSSHHRSTSCSLSARPRKSSHSSRFSGGGVCTSSQPCHDGSAGKVAELRCCMLSVSVAISLRPPPRTTGSSRQQKA
mmetsp:Transcript_49319/g.145658  ORF Transcript_49319/g.145658 Transcript_49319/m.145658 type:complete len:256 (-) Transcript_49319:7-774(-)